MASPLLDPVVIDQLRQVAGDDLALLSSLFDSFDEDVAKLIAEIETAAQTQTFEDLRIGAHALKGAAANVGAGQLAADCLELETVARERKPERLTDLVAVIRDHCRESSQALRREFGVKVS